MILNAKGDAIISVCVKLWWKFLKTIALSVIAFRNVYAKVSSLVISVPYDYKANRNHDSECLHTLTAAQQKYWNFSHLTDVRLVICFFNYIGAKYNVIIDTFFH